MTCQYLPNDVIIAAVEGGGTSFVLAVAKIRATRSSTSRTVADSPDILFRKEIDSSHDQPQQTLKECVDFFVTHKPKNGYASLGIATFGPVGLDPTRKTYGCILGSSPKRAWRNVDFLRPLSNACRGSQPLAVKIETDVNAPAFAEYLLEKDRLSSVGYVTVGTGIGVGLVIHGKPVHGRMHPEGGHVPVQPLPGDTSFEGYSWGGNAPFYGRRTVEGMTSSVALTERLEMMSGERNLPRSSLAALPDDHEIWDHSANALANLCATLLLTNSLEKIVLGGGIMNRKGLIEKVQKQTVLLLNGYLELPKDMGTLICKSSYGNDVGLIGTLVLAENALSEMKEKNAAVHLGTQGFTAGFVHGVVVGVGVTICATIMLANKRKVTK